MDQGRGRGNKVYRARVTLGERSLRELQRPFQGRALKSTSYSLKECQRVIEKSTLQYELNTVSFRIQTARTRKIYPHRARATAARNF